MKDLRDPTLLGEALLGLLRVPSLSVPRGFGGARESAKGASQTMDEHYRHLANIPDYRSTEGPIEKYGDPTKLPSTMP